MRAGDADHTYGPYARKATVGTVVALRGWRRWDAWVGYVA